MKYQPDSRNKALNAAYPFLTLLNSHLSLINLLILHKTMKIPDENGSMYFCRHILSTEYTFSFCTHGGHYREFTGQHISDISDVTDFLLIYHAAESCTEVQQMKQNQNNWIFWEHIVNLQNNQTLLNEEFTWTPFCTGTVSTLFHCTRFVMQFRRATCQRQKIVGGGSSLQQCGLFVLLSHERSVSQQVLTKKLTAIFMNYFSPRKASK